MRNSFRELETDCYLAPPKRKPTLTMANHGQRGTTWEFECPNSITDESTKEGYSVTCKFTKQDCPVYYVLLRQADEMSDKEYERASSK